MAEGVVHEGPSGGGVVLSQFVLHNHGVVAVVEVRGFIEVEAAVFH